MWYFAYEYKNGEPYMVNHDYNTFVTTFYPIKPDGTLDFNNTIEENRKYYGRRIL